MARNRNLDLLKTICSFLVVCIHAPFPGIVGTILSPLTAVAVPLFFMITGYYYTHTKERHREKKQLVKILKLFIMGNLLYFLWSLLLSCIRGRSIITYLLNTFNLTSIGNFLLFNESPVGAHLWYLGAILYVLAIIFLFEKKWSREKLYPLVPVLLLAGLIFGKYSILMFGRDFPYIWVRNFLCTGLPYFLIGDMIYARKIRVKPKTAMLLATVFFFTTLAERNLLVFFNLNGQRDHYISTTFLAIALFLPALQNSECSSKSYKRLCQIGEKLSTSIYILHPILITLLMELVNVLVRHIPYLFVYYSTEPIWVFLCTLILVWGMNRILHKTRLSK